jgi:serine/threonine protein kinase
VEHGARVAASRHDRWVTVVTETPPRDWNAIKAVFLEAVELNPDEREAFLARACGADTGLRTEVESLLTAHDDVGPFLDEPPVARAAQALSAAFDESHAVDTLLQPGARIGQYEVIEPLGSGGMGEVYRAHDTKLDRFVALKIVLDSETARTANRVLREARAASALNHPNICTLYEVGEFGGRPYLAMEYIAGQPLSSVIPAEGLGPTDVVKYGVQVADALAHAHEHGVIHRDLKAANVVVTPRGRAKVLDFGIARRLTAVGLRTVTGTLTEAGTISGTLAYIAPERLRDQPADARSDIWALGVLLYEMATGRRPFAGDTTFEVSSAILKDPPPPLPAKVPAHLRAVILECLEREPSNRFQQASDVVAALEAYEHARRVDLRSMWFTRLRQQSPSSPIARLSRPFPVRAREQRLILGLPPWLLAPLIPMAIVSLGFVSSAAFNTTIGLNPRFGWESPVAWLREGFQFVLGAGMIAGAVALVIVSLRKIRRALSSRFPTIGRLNEGVSQDIRAVVVWLGLDNPYLVAQAVSILGATALAITLWSFADIINAFWHPINGLLPEQVAVLGPESTARTDYMNILLMVVLALAFSVRYVFAIRRRTGINDRVGWPITSLVVLAIGILFLAMPYRIMFHNRFERIRFQGNPCFVIGENRLELMLHCPTIPPPRNRAVSRDSPELTDRSTAASIYSVPRD